MYLIDVPPPTISGKLHMGHCFAYTHMDFIARYHKLKQKILYPFCFDNNGLPTEKLGLKAGCRFPQDIKMHSVVVATDYKELFDKLYIDFQEREYQTYSESAIKLCNMSFEDLKRKGLCYKAETEYLFCPETLVSISQSELDENGCFERSGVKAIVKKGEGWFIKIKNNIEPIKEMINDITWRPEMFKQRLLSWLDSIEYDWSISRERKYGIPIPDEPGMTFDTWFISSLTPQLAWACLMGEETLKCPVFDIRFQGHDIIRTWALYTIVKSLYHNQQIPWKTIIINGHVLGDENKKLSKSKNVREKMAETCVEYIHHRYDLPTRTPHDYLNKYGSAGVRYWAAHNQMGTDTRVDEAVMERGKRLQTKIRNAGRFLRERENAGTNNDFYKIWLAVEEQFHTLMKEDNFPEGLHLLETFFWDTYCDQWIESSKKNPCNITLRAIYEEILPLFEIYLPEIETNQTK